MTLAYPRQLEGEAYADVGEGYEALERLSQICSSVPVHVILGEENLKSSAYATNLWSARDDAWADGIS